VNELNLDQRERLGLIFAATAVLLVVFLLIYIPTGPREKYRKARQQVRSLGEDLKLAALVREEEEQRLKSQKTLMERLEARPDNFVFITFIERKLVETQLRDRAELDQYRPRGASARQPMVKLRLENVSLEELVNFLHEVYSSQNVVALYQLRKLEPAPNNRGLDCDMTLVTLKEA